MRRLLWFSLLVALMTCAQRVKAQPPASSIQIGSTNVAGGVPGNCLIVNSARRLGQQVCGGGGGGVTSITAGTGISVNAATGAVTVTNTAPGALPIGPTGAIQFKVDASTFGGTSDLTRDPATGNYGMFVSPFPNYGFFVAPSTLSENSIGIYFSPEVTATADGGSPTSLEIDVGLAGSHNYADASNLYLYYNNGSSGTITAAYQLWIDQIRNVGGGTITTNYAIFSAQQDSATNNYYTWFDSQGVRRVRDDTTFNSVHQAVECLYDPQFTKYTPGAANFQRGCTGQFESGVFVITPEASGTGVLPTMRLGDTGVSVTFGGLLINHSVTFAALGTPPNGTQYYCSDCTVTSGVDNTCAASGTGSWTERINGAWKCWQ